MERRLREMPRRRRRTSRSPIASTIVNPARLDDVRADDVCIQCHSQGQPRAESDRGALLRLAGRLSAGRPVAATSGVSKSIGSARRRSPIGPTARRTRTGCRATISCRARCRSRACAATPATIRMARAHEADLRLPGNDVCLQCHNGVMQPGPRGSLEFHTQHAAE